jgi:hypothetical protein
MVAYSLQNFTDWVAVIFLNSGNITIITKACLVGHFFELHPVSLWDTTEF